MSTIVLRDILPRGNFGLILSWKAFFQKVLPLCVDDSEDSLFIDLHDVNLFDPDGLLLLLLLGLQKRQRGLRRPQLRLPYNDPTRLNYLKSIGFLRVANSLFDMPPMDDAVDGHPRLFEFLWIQSQGPNSVSSSKIPTIVDQSLGSQFFALLGVTGDGEEFFEKSLAFRNSIIETCLNVAEHSGERVWEGTGFFIARAMPFKTSSTIRLCIGDVGKGLKQRLPEVARAEGLHSFVAPKTDQEAIMCALKFREGSTKKGLCNVIDYVKRWQGSFRIHSGTAQYSMDQQRGGQERFFQGNFFPGVQILIELRATRSLKQSEVDYVNYRL